ncbi:hypothetical protein [Paenimyroides aestuarii]|uniref:Lipocalin-like domain-containing protein n=1 Tax=Paenimyroides aestuarii TaxID=2968490 RepID=A0ABY5NSD7_9FLAO|nr:hypothetical protein [Paenimyroides aestuarii]UUV21438.1 hypothetical protein NPX36_14120 [Paenimyroides aestuarii]
MRKILSFIVFATVLVSCSKPISAEQLQHLNGYWEISEAKTEEGDLKTFQSNNNVDYFQLNGDKGTRSKIVPQLNGKAQSNGIQEQFVVIDSANATYLKYTTQFTKWTEKIDQLSKDQLVIINNNNVKYTYKRYTPIQINE